MLRSRRRTPVGNANSQLDPRFPRKSRQSEKAKACFFRLLSALVAAVAISTMFGCATPHAILNFAAPSAVTAGVPFTVTVTVTYEGKPDTVVNSYISFTSSDPAAVLPLEYQFTSVDAGSHTWTNGFVLKTPGNQTISATLYDASGINGTANVTVSP